MAIDASPEILIEDAIYIICFAIFTALLSEGVSWLVLYWTPEYKELIKDIFDSKNWLQK